MSKWLGAILAGMTRKGFVVFSFGVLFGLPLLYVASLSALGLGFMPTACGAGLVGAGCVLMRAVSLLALPLLIVLAGIGMGVVVMFRARAAQLSGLWGFLAMILTVQGLALIATIVVEGGANATGGGALGPLEAAFGSSALWLLLSFVVFLLLVPDWAGPRALDLGLSAVAAFAAIIVIAVGYAIHGGDGAFPEPVVTQLVGALPHVDWIGLGVFVTALLGILAGRWLPEAK